LTVRYEDFTERLRQLHEVVMSAISFHAVWQILQLHDEAKVSWSLEEQKQLLGRWSGFLTPVGIGLQRISLIELAKVFDTHSKTSSLVNLLGAARRDPSLIPYGGPDDLKEIKIRMREAHSTYGTLIKLRNQRLAHVDFLPDKLPPLMSQGIESLINDVKFSFNRLCAVHDNSTYSWDHAIGRIEQQTAGVLKLLMADMKRAAIEHDDEMVAIILGQLRRMEATMGRTLDDDEVESVLAQFQPTGEQARRIREQLD